MHAFTIINDCDCSKFCSVFKENYCVPSGVKLIQGNDNHINCMPTVSKAGLENN